MNIVNSLYSREQGKRICRNYNIALKRLKCQDYDEFRGILPSTDGPDFNPEPPVFACSFCNTPTNEHLLALANEDGKIAIQDTKLKSDHNPFEGHQAHRNAIFDIAWTPGEMKLLSASGDHTAVLWDVQASGQLQEISRFHAHTRSVKTVAFPQEDKSIFATGARDGVIMLWDTRIQRSQLAIRPDKCISNSHSAPGTPGSSSGSRNRRAKAVPSRASSITGLVFQNAHSLVSCGAGDGKVKVWDIRKSYSTNRREPQPQYSMSTPNGSGRSGFTCLALDPGGHKLYASCMDNTIYCYNIATYEEQPVGVFKGHKNGTFYVKACLSPDGRYLLSGSSDEHAYIWDTSALSGDVYMPIVKLVGHGAEVTSVAWRPVGEVMIVTCSDDARHCLWRVGQEHSGDNDQIELHGWAEAVEDETQKKVLRTPVTPATPSFTSWRRWGPVTHRTPDSVMKQVNQVCESCHLLSTPCLRCIALRTPLPAAVPHGSKKRLEVLWEEEGFCPECEREAKKVSNLVPYNVDASARRLFSPNKKRSNNENESPTALKLSPPKRIRTSLCSPSKRRALANEEVSVLEPSPKKQCTSSVALRTSPRKKSLLFTSEDPLDESESFPPRKKFKINENASTSSIGIEQNVSPQSDKTYVSGSSGKMAKSATSSGMTCAGTMPNTSEHEAKPLLKRPSGSPTKPPTPLKRRISDRHTASPHKRPPPCDDLQGITKIEDTEPTAAPAQNRREVLCKRHRQMGFSSPTLNLPNYVLDGTSPHHKCSPVHQPKENVDWLTKLRRERTSTDKRQETENITEQDTSTKLSATKKTSSQTSTSKATSNRVTPAKISSSRITPGKTSLNRSSSTKGSSSRTPPAKSSQRRTTPAKSSATQSPSHSPGVAERKSGARRSTNSDLSAASNGPSRSTSTLMSFFRVSEKPVEDQCSLGNSPSCAVPPAIVLK